MAGFRLLHVDAVSGKVYTNKLGAGVIKYWGFKVTESTASVRSSNRFLHRFKIISGVSPPPDRSGK
jgi:hypothetical protein